MSNIIFRKPFEVQISDGETRHNRDRCQHWYRTILKRSYRHFTTEEVADLRKMGLAADGMSNMKVREWEETVVVTASDKTTGKPVPSEGTVGYRYYCQEWEAYVNSSD